MKHNKNEKLERFLNVINNNLNDKTLKRNEYDSKNESMEVSSITRSVYKRFLKPVD